MGIWWYTSLSSCLHSTSPAGVGYTFPPLISLVLDRQDHHVRIIQNGTGTKILLRFRERFRRVFGCGKGGLHTPGFFWSRGAQSSSSGRTSSSRYMPRPGHPPSQWDSPFNASHFSSRWNWDSPTPLAAGKCAPPPFGPGGRAHSLAAKGVGESQFQRGDIHCGALYI